MAPQRGSQAHSNSTLEPWPASLGLFSTLGERLKSLILHSVQVQQVKATKATFLLFFMKSSPLPEQVRPARQRIPYHTGIRPVLD